MTANKTLHRTAIPLPACRQTGRSIAASELSRYAIFD